jgi:hypothetical protein
VQPVRDFSLNFRAIRRPAWQRLETHERGNAFLLEMIADAAWRGLAIREVPVHFGDRIHGESKLRLTREAPKYARTALALALRRGRGRGPASGARDQ